MARIGLTISAMFTCENCHREKPDCDCVPVGRWVSFAIGIVTPLHLSVVCRRCSRRVMKLGIVALVGLLVITIVTVLVLNFTVYNI